MAAGLVAHDITTSSGETFTVLSWVPDTGSPDVNAKPIHVAFDTTGAEVLTAAQVTAALGYLDGVEGKLDAIHTDLGTTLAGYLDGLEGHVDGLEALITSTNTALTAGASSIAKAEDVASAGGDVGVPAMAIQQSSPADTAANADYAMLQMSGGRLWGSSQTYGEIAHGGVDSGNPVKVGAVAIAHGTNPTAVAAADRTNLYANRAGIPFVISGHPNVIARSATIDDADGAQTNASLLTVSGGSKIVVTSISATCSGSNSGAIAVRLGFGTATLAAASETGADGILLEGKFPAGGGHQRGNGAGILGVGADGEDLRVTCDDPVGGSLFVTFSYYTIES